MKKILGSLAAAILFNACAVTAKLPLSRFESPEANGKWLGAEGQIAYQGRNEIEFTDDFTRTQPNLSDPSIETPDHRLMAEGSLGILERLDVNLQLPHGRFGLKYQWLGETRANTAQGNFSLASSAGISTTKKSETGTRILSNQTASYSLKETLFDFALIFGYRIVDTVLLYGGPFYVMDKVTVSHSFSSSVPEYQQKGTIKSLGGNLGFQFTFDKIFFRIEGAGSQTKLGNASVGRGTYGLSGGVQF